MNMKELYETVVQAHKDKELKQHEIKQKEESERRDELKEVQQKFVEHFKTLVVEKINKVKEDPKYLKKYIDVLQFKLPPKKNEDDNVDFGGHLLIELMEGPKECNYVDHFKASNTEPTINMLRDACEPLKVHYGYYYKFGNVIQIRWDDIVPGWALSEPEHFESKKAASRKNRQGPRNNVRSRRYNNDNNNENNYNRERNNLKNPFEMMRKMQGTGPGTRPIRFVKGNSNGRFNNNRRNNQVHRVPGGRNFSRASTRKNETTTLPKSETTTSPDNETTTSPYNETTTPLNNEVETTYVKTENVE